MSKFSETATTVRNQAHLVAALSELGYKAEIQADGAALVGYEGRERPERAHVIIRRAQIGQCCHEVSLVADCCGSFRKFRHSALPVSRCRYRSSARNARPFGVDPFLLYS